MKQPPVNKNGKPRLCNRRYRVIFTAKLWSELRYCRKPVGHKGRCGTEIIA